MLPMKMPFGFLVQGTSTGIAYPKSEVFSEAGLPGFETVASLADEENHQKTKAWRAFPNFARPVPRADVNMIGCQMTIDLLT